MSAPLEPIVSVVIPTCNRGDRVVGAIRTIARTRTPPFEIRVVDQSGDRSTEDALAPLLADPRIHYVRTATVGISAGLNVGIGEARSELVAITGDDCVAPEGWLDEMVAAFAVDPRVGIALGNVLPGPYDSRVEFVPAYVREHAFLARGLGDRHRIGGTSACMGIRRSLWRALHGFDPMLGIGAPMKSGEDADVTTRALLAGHRVYETPRVAVTHQGRYRLSERNDLIHRYWFGTGAALAKNVKLGGGAVVMVLVRLGVRWMAGGSPVAASLGGPSHRWRRLAAFARGFAAGAAVPVDRATGHYRPRARVRDALPAVDRSA